MAPLRTPIGGRCQVVVAPHHDRAYVSSMGTGSTSPEGAVADPGDFYVEADCCILCGVPEEIAPEIFETGDDHCFVKRQPCSQEEVDRAIRAMWSGEVDCIRYRGRDGGVLDRIARAGMIGQADHPEGTNAPLTFRDRFASGWQRGPVFRPPRPKLPALCARTSEQRATGRCRRCWGPERYGCHGTGAAFIACASRMRATEDSVPIFGRAARCKGLRGGSTTGFGNDAPSTYAGSRRTMRRRRALLRCRCLEPRRHPFRATGSPGGAWRTPPRFRRSPPAPDLPRSTHCGRSRLRASWDMLRHLIRSLSLLAACSGGHVSAASGTSGAQSDVETDPPRDMIDFLGRRQECADGAPELGEALPAPRPGSREEWLRCETLPAEELALRRRYQGNSRARAFMDQSPSDFRLETIVTHSYDGPPPARVKRVEQSGLDSSGRMAWRMVLEREAAGGRATAISVSWGQGRSRTIYLDDRTFPWLDIRSAWVALRERPYEALIIEARYGPVRGWCGDVESDDRARVSVYFHAQGQVKVSRQDATNCAGSYDELEPGAFLSPPGKPVSKRRSSEAASGSSRAARASSVR